MKAKITWYIITFLLILVSMQFLVLTINKARMKGMPIFLPSTLKWEQERKNKLDPIYSQHKDSFSEGHISGITVDDLVRGMLSGEMEQDKNLALSKKQAIQIFPILKDMTEKRARLLQLRHLRHRLNEDSIQAGILIAQALTPEQLTYIINNRERAISLLQGVPYWKQLIESLEKKLPDSDAE